MNRSDALAAVRTHLTAAGIDYPRTGLVADRFEAGWAVYAPTPVGDGLDDLLDMPVGQAVFLIADSGRIQQISSTTPPRLARQRFAEDEYRRHQSVRHDPALHGITTADADAGPETVRARRSLDDLFHRQADDLTDLIADGLTAECPPHWQHLDATFTGTITAITGHAHWQTPTAAGTIAIPDSVLDLLAEHRDVGAAATSGPWWRLLLTADRHTGTHTICDYGDHPFPPAQLQPVDNYRADLTAYPRTALPAWLAGYLTGPTAQGRTPDHPASHGRPTPTQDLPDLGALWTRWAVLTAIGAAARSSSTDLHAGPDTLGYQPATGDSATLHRLGPDRAVLSGGTWNSPLLTGAYRTGRALPDLYAGAPDWVDDTVLDDRNRRRRQP